MRAFLFLVLLTLTFSSCFDMSMKVEVDQNGSVQYEGDFDLSSMMPLMMMAMEMEPDTTDSQDPFSDLLRAGESIDSIMSISDLEEGLDPNDALVQKLDEQFKMRMKIDQATEQFSMQFRARFDDLKMQSDFKKLIQESKENGSEGIMGGMDESDEMFDVIFINELDLEAGYLTYKTVLTEKSEDDMSGSMGNPFGPSIVPGMQLSLTVPGKIKSVEGAEYALKDDWTASIRIPLETDDPDAQLIRVNFEPKSIFTKPEVTEQWDPKPEKVTFDGKYDVPSDATVLIGEDGPKGWKHTNGGKLQWKWDGEALTVKPGSGDIETIESFGDCQLHIEWKIPIEKGKSGQGKGNSGIFLQSRYEVQVLDSYENSTYPNGQAGSIYKQFMPDVNATRAPNEWQVYDIIYKAPKFNVLGGKDEPARITVIHNGVIIHNDREIRGTTEYIGLPKNSVHGDAPLKLQDHSNEVSYRNVWVRKL